MRNHKHCVAASVCLVLELGNYGRFIAPNITEPMLDENVNLFFGGAILLLLALGQTEHNASAPCQKWWGVGV